MELLTFTVPRSAKRLVIAPIGDIQWNGRKGPTATKKLKAHLAEMLERDAYFVGLGDYIDFLSPSGRAKLRAAGFYDNQEAAIADKAKELVDELYETILSPTTGRWLGLVHGHHFYEDAGWHSDDYLASLLKTQYLGTSCFLHNKAHDFTMYIHHGSGNGVTPGVSANKLYHKSANYERTEVFCHGHSTKLSANPISKTFPHWGNKRDEHKMEHRDVYLVSCGGWAKSNIIGNRRNGHPVGDYAEQGGMSAAPLKGPIIEVNLRDKDYSTRTRVTV